MHWGRWTPQITLAEASAHVLAWRVARSDSRTPSDSALPPAPLSLAMLDPDERERAERFVYDRHRLPYVQAHVRCRELLAAYAGVPAQAVRYAKGAAGKPRLVGGPANLKFNLTHTDGWCALVLCRGGVEVGIDLERVRRIEPQVAESHFSALECEQLRTLTADAWSVAFFRCWTRKEAILKGEGLGLGVPLDAFDVSLLPGEPAQLLGARAEAGFRQDWTLHAFEPEEGVVGAVALSAPLAPVFFYLG